MSKNPFIQTPFPDLKDVDNMSEDEARKREVEILDEKQFKKLIS